MTNSWGSWRALLAAAEGTLREAGVREAGLDAWYLLEHVTGMTRTDYLMHLDEEPGEAAAEAAAQFQELVGKRAERIPLSYLTGTRMFMGLEFEVTESVLIPRQDTECLVEAALPYVGGADVLDLCTGSGCIGISLAVLGRPKSVTAVDLSPAALAVAKQNGKRELHGTELYFLEGDLFEPVAGGSFDLIVSNPPYVRRSVIGTLEPEVRDHEPWMALDGTEDGLAFYRRIAGEAASFLRENGRLFLEIGFDQGEAVAQLVRSGGFSEVEVRKDLAGLDRVVSGRLVEKKQL